MKANRILGAVNAEQSNQKQRLVVGSVHRGGHIEKMIDPENPPQTFMPGKMSHVDSSANLESSILLNQQKLSHDAKLKEDLISFMKQEDQMISFNSSAPRFKSYASHHIRVFPAVDGKLNMAPVDFKVRRDQSEIGPGTYLSPTEIENQARLRRLQNAPPPENLVFGSTAPR